MKEDKAKYKKFKVKYCEHAGLVRIDKDKDFFNREYFLYKCEKCDEEFEIT